MDGHYASYHKNTVIMKCEILSFRSGTDDGSNLLRCDTMYIVEQLQNVRRSFLPSSSGCTNSFSWALHGVKCLTLTDVS